MPAFRGAYQTKLNAAISKVYPWTTFPVPIGVFAFDVLRHLLPADEWKELQESSTDPNGRLANYLYHNFHIGVGEMLIDGSVCFVYTLPENARRRKTIVKRLQEARDAEMYGCQ